MPIENAPSGDDLATAPDAPDGQWLFRTGGLLMGPVSGEVLVQKLQSGEITPDTPVAAEDADDDWTRLGEVPEFKVHVARAEAHQRVLREKRTQEAQARKGKVVRAVWTVVGVSAGVIAVFGAVVWLVTAKPWRSEADELADIGITVSPPVIALASASPARDDGETWLDVDVDRTGGHKPAPRARPSRRPRPSPAKPAPDKGPAKGTQLASATQEPPSKDGLGTQRAYDMDHINAVVAKQSRTLFPCIKDEVRRTGFKGTIPFEFVINNDGRVGRLWIDNRDLRGTPLEKCFKNTMARWRFRSFPGERPTVSQSFTVGK